LDSTSSTSVPKRYIAPWIKLDFFNDSNLKSDIQNRISPTVKTDFIMALQDMKGDSKDGGGISFSEVTLLAMAYFYSEIFKGKIENKHYSLEMVKGFLDGNNLTSYTAIYEVDVEFFKLLDAPYFKHCWLVVQCAWYFNSEHFGHHQYIDYMNHFIISGEKLPIENYNYDRTHLEEKHKEFEEERKTKGPINEFKLVSDWYYGILFLVCKELDLSTTHFNVFVKDNREYNPLSKTSRQLRNLAPFKIIECDIKSAFPTFLDSMTGAKLKDLVYNNLMKSNSISRREAKVLFNRVCNSRKYKTKDFTAEFFRACGYSEEHIEMLLYYTYNDHLIFFQFMTRKEEKAINTFVKQNNLERGARLHDALLFLDTNVKAEYLNMKVLPNCDFGYKELNRPVIKESFCLSQKQLPYAYINSIPKGLNLIAKHDYLKSYVVGEAGGFRFYKKNYKYISASFNLNDHQTDYRRFHLNCKIMFSTLQYFNKQVTDPRHIYLILRHIRERSNIVFNVRAMYFKVLKYKYDATLIAMKKRDYDFVGDSKFKRKIDYVKALNISRGVVNCNHNLKELYSLIEERIINEDYGFLNELSVKGHRNNNILVYVVVRKFNLLCNGRLRTTRKTVKGEALYNTPIKSLPAKSITSSNRTAKATMVRQKKKQQRELIESKRFIDNRPIAQQLLLILGEVVGEKTDVNLVQNLDVQSQLKLELISMADERSFSSIEDGVAEFDLRYIKKIKSELPIVLNSQEIYQSDLNNSVFHQISMEEASNSGEPFFTEYIKFHNLEFKEVHKLLMKSVKLIYNLPEVDFDSEANQ
jgi:hypothetical protein